MDDGLRARLRALPKTELHLHALGALRPATVVDLARRKGAPILPAAERGAAAAPAFAPVFLRARAAGIAPVAHAGEAAGPESVRGALDLYGAVRIGHGTRCVEDMALMHRLADEQIPVEVCPTSNEA